ETAGISPEGHVTGFLQFLAGVLLPEVDTRPGQAGPPNNNGRRPFMSPKLRPASYAWRPDMLRASVGRRVASSRRAVAAGWPFLFIAIAALSNASAVAQVSTTTTEVTTTT